MIRDVVIVGGGPVGLVLACELRLQGASVTFLEQQGELTGTSEILRLDASAIDMPKLRGLLEHFHADSSVFNTALAHFSSALSPRRQLADHGSLLEEYAYELGVRLRWGHEVIAREQAADGMLLHIRDPHGEYELRARHLVECDDILYGQFLVNAAAGSANLAARPESLIERH